MIGCEFPEEFIESEGIIPNVTLETTLSESEKNSKLIDGREEYFPFDEYTLDLYVVFLAKKGEHSKLHLEYMGVGPGVTELSPRIENEVKNIEDYPEIKDYFLKKENLSTENIEPVIQRVTFKFGTDYSLMFSLAVFFWPFYLITGIGLWFSLRPENVSRSVVEVLFTSAILLLALSTYYLQVNPSEITVSTVTAMIKVNAFMLMLSFTFVWLAPRIIQYGLREGIKQKRYFAILLLILHLPLVPLIVFRRFPIGITIPLMFTSIILFMLVVALVLKIKELQHELRRRIKSLLHYFAFLVFISPPLVILLLYQEIFLSYLKFFVLIPAIMMALAILLPHIFSKVLGDGKKTKKVRKK